MLQKTYFLEPLVALQAMQSDGELKMHPIHGAQSTRQVCVHFFKWVLQISNNHIYQPTIENAKFQINLTPRVHSTRKCMVAFKIVEWLRDTADFYLHDPASEIFFMPYGSKLAVWQLYESQAKIEAFGHFFTWREDKIYVPSYNYFRHVWKTSDDLKHVKLHKYLKFSKCDLCVEFINRRNFSLNDEQKTSLKKEEYDHHMFVRRERQSYYARTHHAKTHKDESLSVILDGADQSAYGVPHFAMKSKTIEAAHKVALKIMGAIVHGRDNYAYTYLPNIKHGSNITIEVLHRILLDQVNKYGKLPPVLYLQLDNTSKQCKSKYVLGYLACLVQWGIFERVVLSFLPVGHTHEDIDQMFSRLAVRLRTTDCLDRQAFIECFKKAFKNEWGTEGTGGHVETAANISDWIAPYLADTKKMKTAHKKVK